MRLRQCLDCQAFTTGRIRFRRNGWRGVVDRLCKRLLPLCVDCARANLRARYTR